ncbi:MAG: RNA polymerase sigma factor [Acutalibacteraceae bacterium]
MIAVFLSLLDTETEKEKFKELYDTYKDLLYWIAFKRTNNAQDSEECVQETFLYIAKNFKKVGEVGSKRTKGYLSTVVTGFAIDVYNKSKEMINLSVFDENVEDIACFENYDKSELLSVFDEILDEESRIFLYLKYVYSYKSSEIAEIYNVSDTYVRKKLQYAKEKLRNYFEEK